MEDSLTSSEKTLLRICCQSRLNYIHNIKSWSYAERATAKADVMGLYRKITGEDLEW